MNLEVGKQHINNTWRYLAPCLVGHGREFTQKFNRLFKIAVCIHDTLVDGSIITEGRTLFVMFDKKYQPYYYQAFMEFLRKQDYYRGEYCPESEIFQSRKQVVVIEVPEKHFNSYDYFLKGEYSKMYEKEDVDLYFSSSYKQVEYQVLTRTGEKGFNSFMTKVSSVFYSKEQSSIINPEDFKDSEWELPLEKEQEIFNYKKEDIIYFNQKLDKTWQN